MTTNPEDTSTTVEGTETTSTPGTSSLVAINQSKQAETLEKLIQEDDLDKVKDLTHLFNVYQTKRNAIRISALNDVQDALVQQMLERLRKYPDNFANKDIADWMKTVQAVMESNTEKVEHLDNIPAITYQQNNQVNVNVPDTLSRESREKIINVVESLLKSVQSSGEDTVYTDGLTEIEEDSSGEVEESSQNKE